MNNETMEQQPIIVNLTLNLNQIGFILGALDDMKTGTGAWMVRNAIVEQVNPQIQELQAAQQPAGEETVQ